MQQNVLVCYPAGDLGAGAECGMSDMNGGCQRGLVCSTPPLGGDPACRTICDPRAPSCPEGEVCQGLLPGFNPNRERLCVPVVACDIFAKMDCQAGQKCDLSPNSPTLAECYPDGNIAEGQNCGGGSCRGGLVCASFNNAPPTCRPVCDPTEKMRRTCASGSCVELAEYPGIGFCTP